MFTQSNGSGNRLIESARLDCFGTGLMPSTTCRALLISPRCIAGGTIMIYPNLREVLGCGYLMPPLGLLTVAALLPRSWDVRLIDHNFQKLTTEDLDQADIVMTGGMLTQQHDALEIIRLAHARGKPVVVGGPDLTSSPHVYSDADFQVRGEAESVMDEFLAAWNSGARSGVFEAEKFQADITRSPIPRYDLIKFEDYFHSAVQFSRGCPFTCEFCDIIELFGRVPRTKTPEQVLGELDALYRLGYRGPVSFVDDNLIGNKKEIRKLLPLLKAWQEERGYPFEFSTQATVNLGDDPQLLALMSEANFAFVFFGIESPDPETLISTKKKVNAIRNLTESVANVHGAGMFASAGIIVGFDSEKDGVAEGIIDYIRAAAITVVHPGLLVALPNTQFTRRLAQEGRLHANAELSLGEQATWGLNFETKRPRREVLKDYVMVLDALFTPQAYLSRLRAQARAVKRPKLKTRVALQTSIRALPKMLRILWRMTTADRALRREFWHTVFDCSRNNIGALKYAVVLAALYFDWGPYVRALRAQVEREIELIERGEWHPPMRGATSTAGTGMRANVKVA
jgi:radical SAM superfamily enzyme YgiQ (UPF0313 family)